MTRLEELEELISKQELAVNDKRIASKAIADAYAEKIKKTIEALLNVVAPVNCYISAPGFSVSGRVDLKLEDPYDSYGSGFEFYYDTPSCCEDKDKYCLTVNIGTCGSFGIDNEAQFAKYKVFTQFLDNFKEIEETFADGFDTVKEAISLYYTGLAKLNTLTHEKHELERQIENQKILELIKPDNLYINTHYIWYSKNASGFKGYKYVKLISLTEKSANLEVGCINPKGNYNEGWNSRDTYRMNKQDFFDAVLYGRLKETTLEAEMYPSGGMMLL